MIVSQAVLDELKQIGLNLYERKLWAALLSRGTSTAGELSSLAKVPHSRTYDVLESLAEKGFVMIQSSKPLKYVVIAPSEALERSKKKLKEKLNVTLERIEKLQAEVAELQKKLAALTQKYDTHTRSLRNLQAAQIPSSIECNQTVVRWPPNGSNREPVYNVCRRR